MSGGRGGKGGGRQSKNRAKGEEAGHNTGRTFAELQQEQIKRDKNPQANGAIPRAPRPTSGGGTFARMQSNKMGSRDKK